LYFTDQPAVLNVFYICEQCIRQAILYPFLPEKPIYDKKTTNFDDCSLVSSDYTEISPKQGPEMLNIFKMGGVKRVFGHKSGIKFIFAVTLHFE